MQPAQMYVQSDVFCIIVVVLDCVVVCVFGTEARLYMYVTSALTVRGMPSDVHIRWMRGDKNMAT